MEISVDRDDFEIIDADDFAPDENNKIRTCPRCSALVQGRRNKIYCSSNCRKRYKEITEFDKFLDLLATSIYRLASKKTGALVAIEREDSLDELALNAVSINANFSSELLESIFVTTTPLHDGAVILRDLTIVAASVILPLAESSSQITNSMGTRHRAALGVSQITDALLIVISASSIFSKMYPSCTGIP